VCRRASALSPNHDPGSDQRPPAAVKNDVSAHVFSRGTRTDLPLVPFHRFYRKSQEVPVLPSSHLQMQYVPLTRAHSSILMRGDASLGSPRTGHAVHGDIR
jgi:hypothetical protein